MKKLVSLAALLAMVLVAAGSAALAQVSQEEPETEPTTELGVLGFITSISGTEVRVEEDPQDPVFGGSGSDKGSFTVTGQTEILRQQGRVDPGRVWGSEGRAAGGRHVHGARPRVLPLSGGRRQHRNPRGASCRR